MSQRPKTGDRVRLTTRDFEPHYRLGDRGTVLSGPHPIPSGGCFYVVAMKKFGPGTKEIIFHANEIEVDATARERSKELAGLDERTHWQVRRPFAGA